MPAFEGWFGSCLSLSQISFQAWCRDGWCPFYYSFPGILVARFPSSVYEQYCINLLVDIFLHITNYLLGQILSKRISGSKGCLWDPPYTLLGEPSKSLQEASKKKKKPSFPPTRSSDTQVLFLDVLSFWVIPPGLVHTLDGRKYTPLPSPGFT
jgi:hypothetical protein